MDEASVIVPAIKIENRILLIREEKVIVDADLANFYGVSTKRLNEQVKRNRVMRHATSAEVDVRMGGVNAEIVLCGHSHIPGVVRASSGQLIVNPGSVGLTPTMTATLIRTSLKLVLPMRAMQSSSGISANGGRL